MSPSKPRRRFGPLPLRALCSALLSACLASGASPVLAQGQMPDIEGVYAQGEAEVTVRRGPDGQFGDQFIIERRRVVDGELVTEIGRGEIREGVLVSDFDGRQIQGTSLRAGVSQVIGGDAEKDIAITPFVLRVSEAKDRRIRPLTTRQGESAQSRNSDEQTPSDSDVDRRELAPGESQPSNSNSNVAPQTQYIRDSESSSNGTGGDPSTALLASLAIAAALASSRRRGQTGATTASSLASLDPQTQAALAELALLEDLSNTGIPPIEEATLFGEADVRRIVGGKGPLSPAERLVLEYTNEQRLSGGNDVDLASNLREAAAAGQRLATPTQARSLDGANSRVLSPIEQQVLEYTNQQITLGGANQDLRENYRAFLNHYRETAATAEAEALYKAMKGAGTDEEAIFATLRGKSRDQIAILNQAFDDVLRAKGKRPDRGSFGSSLENWLNDELSGGWKEKTFAAYRGEVVQEDYDYFWTSAAGKNWNDFLRDSDAGAKDMIANGNLLEQGIGYLNQGIFGAAGEVNRAVKNAQEFYVDQINTSESGTVRNLAKAGYVLASIGGSFGTKALDPTLEYNETAEGLVDLALLVGTFGAGKLVQAGAKTAAGTKALAQLAKATQQLSRLSYGLKRVTGLAGNATRLSNNAARFRQVAAGTKDALRAQRAIAAADALEAAAKKVADAERALKTARDAETAARALLKSGDRVEDATRLVEEAIAAQKRAKAAIDAARLAEAEANGLARAAGLLNNNALARGYDNARARLASPIGQRAQVVRQVTGKIDETASADVARQLQTMLNRNVGNANGKMTGAQFNKLMDELDEFAKRNGIAITRTTETAGVYPGGLYEIRLAGFDRVSDLAGPVSFKHRHELAHIVHTLQTRATLIKSLGPSGTRLSGQALREAETFLNAIENGSNYLEFEKAVTGIASAAHKGDRALDIGLYNKRVQDLIEGTRQGLHAGKIRFPNGKTFEEVYAMFLSKAPLLTGQSAKELVALRLPAMIFAIYYSTNMDVSAYTSLMGVDPKDLGIDVKGQGFRDLVNAMITEGIHPDRAPAAP